MGTCAVISVSDLTPESVPAYRKGGANLDVITSRGALRTLQRDKTGRIWMWDGSRWGTPTGEILARIDPATAAARKARSAARRSERSERARAVAGAVRPGDVFAASWGYSMTLVDYFEVAKVSGTRVYWREIAHRTLDDQGPAGSHVVPVPGCFVEGGKAGHSTIRGDGYSRPWFRVDDVRDAILWDGRPDYVNRWD